VSEPTHRGTQDDPPARRRARGSKRPRAGRGEIRGRLKPHDPFELIRWLAISQPDPRKALAELVQNSLDAGARKIRIVRAREKGLPCLFITDDGDGIIPEMDRVEALRYIATHIGHSRKRSLSPQQRLQLMTQGQYGIGLLGFWSLGEMLEIRTALAGQRAQRLLLHRDRPDFVIEPLRGRLPLDERWTQVVVVGLHREALAVLAARRAGDYLAAELRGQLLARDVDLTIEDRMSRGRSQKMVIVRPPKFLGERLEALTVLDVPGHAPARLEIHVASEPGPRLALYCSGTLVADSFDDLGSLGLDRSPWTDPRLTGLIDFPDFQVAPGSRRGLVPDEAAGAFARALLLLEPVLLNVLESLDRRRDEEIDRGMMRDLQRAFRDFYRERPRYEMLPVQTKQETPEAAAGAGGIDDNGSSEDLQQPGEGMPMTVEGAEDGLQPSRRGPIGDLLPPGPLDDVRLTPSPLRVECRGRRRARAAAVDAAGRALEEDVVYSWALDGPVGALVEEPGHPDRVALHAADEPSEGTLTVTARAGGREASASVAVEVLEEIRPRGADEGIPEPELVSQPGAAWRSRFHEGRWQVNTAHRDYRALENRTPLKLRYLAMLFAKEVVLRSSQDPRLEKPLEQLVEITCFADRNFAARRGGRPRRSPAIPGATDAATD
jgi:hypothetical protein